MVDDQLDLARLHDWQVRGLGALENVTCVDADLAVSIRQARSVAHQAAVVDKLTPCICRGYRVAYSQLNQLDTPGGEEGAGVDEQGVGPLPHGLPEGQSLDAYWGGLSRRVREHRHEAAGDLGALVAVARRQPAGPNHEVDELNADLDHDRHPPVALPLPVHAGGVALAAAGLAGWRAFEHRSCLHTRNTTAITRSNSTSTNSGSTPSSASFCRSQASQSAVRVSPPVS
jgi:hypothetical protein